MRTSRVTSILSHLSAAGAVGRRAHPVVHLRERALLSGDDVDDVDAEALGPVRREHHMHLPPSATRGRTTRLPISVRRVTSCATIVSSLQIPMIAPPEPANFALAPQARATSTICTCQAGRS